jgi:hypothetical protein
MPETLAPSPLVNLNLPPLATFCPEYGGFYAGIIRGENGEPSYHLFHAPALQEIAATNWQNAVEKASASLNGFSDWSLPNRRESRLLAINSADSFEEDKDYWTSTQLAGYPDCAWIHGFSDGSQLLNRKSDKYRARPVRRILIIE